MTKKITIHWGTDKEPQDKKSYTFETEEQLKYSVTIARLQATSTDTWSYYCSEDSR